MSKRKEEPKKIQHIVEFKIDGSYPNISRIELSFPATNRFNNVIVSEWFNQRVCVQQVEKNIMLYLHIQMDNKERMPILKVLEILEQKGLKLTHNTLVDLQDVYQGYKKANEKDKSESLIKNIIQELFAGLETLFPENSWYLRGIPISEEDMKNAVPVEEEVVYFDFNTGVQFSVSEDASARTVPAMRPHSDEQKGLKHKPNNLEIESMQTKEQEIKEKNLKALTDRIGKEEYALLRKLANDTGKRFIDHWLINSDAEVEGLLLMFTKIAIISHQGKKDSTDYLLLLLIKLNEKFRFIKENDVELVCDAIKTKNLWCLYQVLNFGIDLNVPLVRIGDPNHSAHRTDIFKAYRYNMLTKVKEKFDAGGDPNEVNEHGQTLLQLARKDKKQECINLLVSYYPPLFLAYELNELSMLEFLLTAGADPNKKGPEGLFLSELADRDKKQNVLELLSQSAEEKSKNAEAAVTIKLQEITDYTTENCDVDLTKQDLEELSLEAPCYDVAIKFRLSGRDTRPVSDFLMQLQSIAEQIEDYKNFAFLFSTLRQRPNKISREELEKISEAKQAEVKALGAEMENLLELFSDQDRFYGELSAASIKFYMFVFDWLNGRIENCSPTQMFNRLFQKVIVNNEPIAFQILIEAHQKRNFIDINNPKLLDTAVRFSQKEFVTALLEMGFDPNGSKENFPLDSAIKLGKLDIVKLLVEKGANPQLLNANHRNFSKDAKLGEYDPKIVEYINQIIKKTSGLKAGNKVEKLESSPKEVKMQAIVEYERSHVFAGDVSFIFPNQDGNYQAEDISGWFNSQGINSVKVHNAERPKRIEIWLNNSETLKAPVKLIHVINILAAHQLGLTDRSNRLLREAYALAQEEIAKKETTEKSQADRARVLSPYAIGADLDDYFRMFPNSIGPREELMYHYFERFSGLEVYFESLKPTLNDSLLESPDNSLEKESQAEDKIEPVSERKGKIMTVLSQEQFDQLNAYLEECKIRSDENNRLHEWLMGTNYNDQISLSSFFSTALHLALLKPHKKFFDFLLNNKLVKPEQCESTMTLAVQTNDITYLQALLAYGVDPDIDVRQCQIHNSPNNTSLFWAFEYRRLDYMRILLEAGAKVETVHFKTGKTVLEMAKEQDWADAVEFISGVYQQRGIDLVIQTNEQSQSSSSSNSSSNSDSSSDTSSEEQEEATPGQKMVRKIFNNLAGNAGPEAFIQNQWTAYGDSKVTEEDFAKTQDYIAAKIKDVKETRFEKFNYSDEATESEIASVKSVQARFQNVFIYAVKLYREHEECKDAKKKAVIEAKVNAVSDFINTIGDLSNLAENKEAIKKACNILEQHDANRGTGFYRVHSFFTNKRYQDEKGRSRLVKSTMGELAYDFYNAVKDMNEGVKKEALKEDVRDEVVDNSVSVGQ